jgi:hypothetical protein
MPGRFGANCPGLAIVLLMGGGARRRRRRNHGNNALRAAR